MNEIKLNPIHRTLLNTKKQFTEYRKQRQDTTLVNRDIKSKITKDNMRKEKEERELEVERLKVDTHYYNVKSEIARLKNRNNVIEILAKNLEESAKEDEKQGSKFCGSYSMLCNLATTLMSIVGIWKTTPDLATRIAIVVLFLCASIFANKKLNSIPKFIDKYLDNKSKDSVLDLSWSIFVCGSVTVASLFTNFKCWNNTSADIVTKFVFSYIFDALAIAFAFRGYKFKNLRYKKSYMNEILGDESNNTINKNDITNSKSDSTNSKSDITNSKSDINQEKSREQIIKMVNETADGERRKYTYNEMFSSAQFYKILKSRKDVEKRGRFYYKKEVVNE